MVFEVPKVGQAQGASIAWTPLTGSPSTETPSDQAGWNAPTPEHATPIHAESVAGFGLLISGFTRQFRTAVAAVMIALTPLPTGGGMLTEAPPPEPAQITMSISMPAPEKTLALTTTSQTTPQLAEVQSLAVSEAKDAIDASRAQLDAALARRHAQIESYLAQLEKNGASQSAIDAARADLAKTIEQIVAGPDSKMVSKDLRADVLRCHQVLTRWEVKLEQRVDAWSAHDSVYASPPVRDALAPLGLRPAHLKALIGQESGDHLIKDTRGDIKGIAQIDSRTLKEVAPGTRRSDDAQSIVAAAQVLSSKAAQLEALAKSYGLDWSAIRASPDFASFVFASYNAGATPIARAMQIADKSGLDASSWEAVSGTPLQIALKTTQTYKGWSAKKHGEVSSYVLRIGQRLPGYEI